MPVYQISVCLNARKTKCRPIKYLSAKPVSQNASLTNVSHKKPFSENVCRLKCLTAKNCPNNFCTECQPAEMSTGPNICPTMPAKMSVGQIVSDPKTRSQLFWKQMNPSRCFFFLQRETNSKNFLSFPKREKEKCFCFFQKNPLKFNIFILIQFRLKGNAIASYEGSRGWRHGTQHNNIQHNDTRHKRNIWDFQRKWNSA